MTRAERRELAGEHCRVAIARNSWLSCRMFFGRHQPNEWCETCMARIYLHDELKEIDIGAKTKHGYCVAGVKTRGVWTYRTSDTQGGPFNGGEYRDVDLLEDEPDEPRAT